MTVENLTTPKQFMAGGWSEGDPMLIPKTIRLAVERYYLMRLSRPGQKR